MIVSNRDVRYKRTGQIEIAPADKLDSLSAKDVFVRTAATAREAGKTRHSPKLHPKAVSKHRHRPKESRCKSTQGSPMEAKKLHNVAAEDQKQGKT